MGCTSRLSEESPRKDAAYSYVIDLYALLLDDSGSGSLLSNPKI